MQLQTTACASAESAYILRSTLHISRLSSQAIWRPWQASIPAQQEPSCAHYSPEISASWYSQEKKSTNVVFYLHHGMNPVQVSMLQDVCSAQLFFQAKHV